ncbi:MAG: hypothetical protein Q8J99_12340 [Sulfuritalea sp.]|nr:hypothetical protein [Sulfuritalea sp.]
MRAAGSGNFSHAASTSMNRALPHRPTKGAASTSWLAWPKMMKRVLRSSSARRSTKTSRQRCAHMPCHRSGEDPATTTPHSSNWVSASRSAPRSARPWRRASVSDIKWRRLSAALVNGQASQISALNRSCQLPGRVAISPFR